MIVTETKCDRCKDEIYTYPGAPAWYILTYTHCSDRHTHDKEKHLCRECNFEFCRFMKGENVTPSKSH